MNRTLQAGSSDLSPPAVSEQDETLSIRPVDWHRPEDGAAYLALLDMYSRDPLGDNRPLAEEVRERLLPDLRSIPGCLVLLAFVGSRPVGLATCFTGYSSFQGRPLLNIHDLAVVPDLRGRGIGRALLAAVEAEARRRGCCRLTLEVRADNTVGQRLYRDCGFEPGDPNSDALAFWKKPLAER